MKLFLLLIVLLPLQFPLKTPHPLNCISYRPFNTPKISLKPAELLESDLAAIAAHGFDCIKTHSSQFQGLKIADYAKNFNLKVILGIEMEDNISKESEIATAIASCKDNENVIALYAGNENLPWVFKKSIVNIKKKVKKQGCSKPFGTLQKIEYFLSNYDKKFLSNFDFLGYTMSLTSKNSGETQTLKWLKEQNMKLKEKHLNCFQKFKLAQINWLAEWESSISTITLAKEFADSFMEGFSTNGNNLNWVSYLSFFDYGRSDLGDNRRTDNASAFIPVRRFRLKKEKLLDI